MSERMRELLRKWANMILTDEASTDEFLCESMTFEETLEMMDHVSKAVKMYTESK